MKIIVFFFCGISTFVFSQGLTLDWANSIGGSFTTDEGRALAIDKLGNVYTTGFFEGVCDVDPSPQVYPLNSNGDKDLFVTKMDNQGNFVWGFSLGGANWDYSYDITTDSLNYICITGTFSGTVDFDPGIGVANLTSTSNILYSLFIAKYDLNGNFIWAKSFEGTGYGIGYSIGVDSLDNCYTIGSFVGQVDFDPGANDFILSSTSKDIFVLKLNAQGDFVYANAIGGAEPNDGVSIAVHPNGNYAITGHFEGIVDFDPGGGTTNLTSLYYPEVYCAKYSENGSLLWAHSVGRNGTTGNPITEKSYEVKMNSSEEVYFTGSFSGTIDFDPGVNNYPLTSNGGFDGYLLKLDAFGNFLWATRLGGINNDTGKSITIENSGDTYLLAEFIGALPIPGSNGLQSNGLADVAIAKFTSSGNFIWAEAIGGTGKESGEFIANAGDSCFYITGAFSGPVDFDLSSNTYEVQSINNQQDVFVANFKKCHYTYSTDSIITCELYTWLDGVTYTHSTSGPTFILENAQGCDSIISLELIINAPSSSAENIQVCDSLNWIDGNTYFNDTTVTYATTNSLGCDSLVTLSLTVLSSQSVDSVRICEGESYQWINGQTYFQSDTTAFHNLSNVFGCDSTITLNLQVDSINTDVWNNDNTFIAVSNNAQYQWLDCIANQHIVGETYQSFTPTSNGTFAVIVSTENCSDTSDCYIINDVGLGTLWEEPNLFAFVNDQTNKITIRSSSAIGINAYEVYNVYGQCVWRKISDEKLLEVDADLPPGFYFVLNKSLPRLVKKVTIH